MSAIQIRKCDGCKKTTENQYAEKGWINFSSSDHISISEAKGRYNKSKSSYEVFYRKDFEDFCSWECFTNFVQSGNDE